MLELFWAIRDVVEKIMGLEGCNIGYSGVGEVGVALRGAWEGQSA